MAFSGKEVSKWNRCPSVLALALSGFTSLFVIAVKTLTSKHPLCRLTIMLQEFSGTAAKWQGRLIFEKLMVIMCASPSVKYSTELSNGQFPSLCTRRLLSHYPAAQGVHLLRWQFTVTDWLPPFPHYILRIVLYFTSSGSQVLLVSFTHSHLIKSPHYSLSL